MIDPTPTPNRRAFRVMGIVIGAVVVATLSAAAAVLLSRQGNVSVARPPAASASATAPAVQLRRSAELRAGPAPDQPIVTRLGAGAPLAVLGRSVDSAWLAVSPLSARDIVGWVPADAVEGLREAGRLPVIADGSPSAVAPPAATRPADLPDLRVEAAASRSNRLVAVIVNDGPGDLPTPILVSVNDGTPVRIETKAGEPLRARERVEATVPGEFVQLRAPVSLRVLTEPLDREARTDNNAWTGIVEPDQPNNLAISGAVAAGADRHLLVTVQNDSPIPVRGSILVTVREALPSTTLLGRELREVALEPGKTVDVPFPDVRQVDLTRIAVRLSTEAISDAVLADNSYPR